MAEGMDLTRALAELAKAGIAFTSELDQDGKRIYIIDSIRLSEDEIMVLQQRRALSRDGIRRYLVDRAA
ncbi:MAG TPA: hypothetical protein VKY31_03825 [Terriglobia bacterium]|nr:hypothetical protein [Terriglobia bacterium]